MVIFESDYMERNAEIKSLILSMVADGKRVMAWGYVVKKEITTAILPDFRIIHQKDTDILKRPLQSFLRELEDIEFDLLLDLTVSETKPLQYLALYANASCKVAVHNIPAMYDLIVDISRLQQSNRENEIETNAIQVYENIIFYLKSIQSND